MQKEAAECDNSHVKNREGNRDGNVFFYLISALMGDPIIFGGLYPISM